MKSTEWTLDIFKSLFKENENVKFDQSLVKDGCYSWHLNFDKDYKIILEYRVKPNLVVIYVDIDIMPVIEKIIFPDSNSINSGIFIIKKYTKDFHFNFKEMVSELNRIREAWNKINKQSK